LPKEHKKDLLVSSRLKIHRLSSNATLVLKIFLPTFWIVFFGLLVIAIFVSDSEDILLLNNPYLKYGSVAFFLLFFCLFYFTIMSLKRVDIDQKHLYVSNYFKTFRYALDDIQKNKEIDFGIFTILRTELKNKGSFGRKFIYILNKSTFDEYLKIFPENVKYFT